MFTSDVWCPLSGEVVAVVAVVAVEVVVVVVPAVVV